MDRYILFSDGKSQHTLKWLKELVKYYDIYLISLNGCIDDVLEYIPKNKIYILNESVNQQGGNVKLLGKYFKLKKLVNKIKPKFLNAHYISSYGVLASLVKNSSFKLIQSAWGTDILVTPFESLVKRKIATFALKKAELITSDSYFMSDKIKELVHESNILTFPFGLSSIYVNTNYKKDKNLIFSNRILAKNYNINKVLEWFSILDNKMKLIIANDGDIKEELQEYVKRNDLFNRVKFVGFLSKSEQEEIYKKAKYYISIPTSDSTSASLLEAMSFGCIPIVSNIPVNREWILDRCNGIFWHKELKKIEISKDAEKINRELINKKAIFSKSIQYFIESLKCI